MAGADDRHSSRTTESESTQDLRGHGGDVEGAGHQGARVGVFGGGNDAVGRASFDDLAVLHDEDFVRERAHDTEVVAEWAGRRGHGGAGMRVATRTIRDCTDMSKAEVGPSGTTKRGPLEEDGFELLVPPQRGKP
jgi:hypothetical protein